MMLHAAALRAVTLEPAIAFGMDKQYGSIQKGKTANLVVWSGDPFEPLTNVEAVIIGGQKVSTENRQTRLFKKYRTLDRRAEPARQKVTTINLNGEEFSVKAKNFTELDRLSIVVHQIDHDCQVVPLGAFKMIPTHELISNPNFFGLKIS